MSTILAPTDMELAAMISSKICHDIISPVGAIYNCIEILGDEDNGEAHSYAMTTLKNVTEQASARLKYARFAYGAAGSAGAQIDIGSAEELCRGYLTSAKQKLIWNGMAGYMPKDRVKLLLNLVAAAVSCLPRGGDIVVEITGSVEQPRYSLKCTGQGVRPPSPLVNFVSGQDVPPIEAANVQAYYTWRLSGTAGMPIEIYDDSGAILIIARA